MRKIVNFFYGGMVGFFLGGVLGLLLAPKKGNEIGNEIIQKLSEFSQQIKEAVETRHRELESEISDFSK
jgi:gas vesicle protein